MTPPDDVSTKLHKIRERVEAATGGRYDDADVQNLARSDVPYLLSLVEEIGEALAAISDQTWSHVEYDLGPRSDTTMMLLDALRDAAQEKNNE